MHIKELGFREIKHRLRHQGLFLEIGPFSVHLKSNFDDVAKNIETLYSEYPLADENFADFHIEILRPGGIRSFYRSQSRFLFDGNEPFKPLPASQSFAFFEWGLNWCVASYAHQYLIIHAGVLERHGKVLIMPGAPGAGKSTLTVALMNNGWRLLSDEMALVDLKSFLVTPIPRPVSLKNESVAVVKGYFPQARFGLLASDTHKGTVTHVKPPDDSLVRLAEQAPCRWIIFPKFESNSPLAVEEISKPDAYMKIAEQCFNYHVHGESSFEVMTNILDASDVRSLRYSKLEEAIAYFNALESSH